MATENETTDAPDVEDIAEDIQIVQLPERTLQRLKSMVLQRDVMEKQITQTVLIALEAMGVEGEVVSADLAKGEVTLKPVPRPTPLNRAQRRKADKEGAQ